VSVSSVLRGMSNRKSWPCTQTGSMCSDAEFATQPTYACQSFIACFNHCSVDDRYHREARYRAVTITLSVCPLRLCGSSKWLNISYPELYFLTSTACRKCSHLPSVYATIKFICSSKWVVGSIRGAKMQISRCVSCVNSSVLRTLLNEVKLAMLCE